MINLKNEVVIIRIDGARDKIVKSSNNCKVEETSSGLLDVPILKSILGIGIEVPCCAYKSVPAAIKKINKKNILDMLFI